VVVGAGAVATRRIETLLDAGAKVSVVAAKLSEGFESLRRSRGEDLTVAVRDCVREDFDGADFVVIAVSDRTVAARLTEEARSQGALVCCATEAALGSVAFPALFTFDDMTVSVSSAGRDPRRARLLRDFLRAAIERDASVQPQRASAE
jgi:siroheme synthase-like protein